MVEELIQFGIIYTPPQKKTNKQERKAEASVSVRVSASGLGLVHLLLAVGQ